MFDLKKFLQDQKKPAKLQLLTEGLDGPHARVLVRKLEQDVLKTIRTIGHVSPRDYQNDPVLSDVVDVLTKIQKALQEFDENDRR